MCWRKDMGWHLRARFRSGAFQTNLFLRRPRAASRSAGTWETPGKWEEGWAARRQDRRRGRGAGASRRGSRGSVRCQAPGTGAAPRSQPTDSLRLGRPSGSKALFHLCTSGPGTCSSLSVTRKNEDNSSSDLRLCPNRESSRCQKLLGLRIWRWSILCVRPYFNNSVPRLSSQLCSWFSGESKYMKMVVLYIVT